MFFNEIALEQIIESLGYIGIFGLMAANGMFSFPSSQILYIVAGYLVGTGVLGFIPATIAGTLGNTLGNYILYSLSKKHGLPYILKLTLLPEREIEKVQAVFRKRGVWFVVVGKLLPAIKVFIPIVAGIGKMSQKIFIPIILATSYIWSCAFITIGYIFGKQTDFFGQYTLILFIVAFIIVGSFYKYMNSASVLKEVEKNNKQ